jgi:glycosyltransferase involved in cell wall biosynthesis
MPEEKNKYEILMENPVAVASTYAGVMKPETDSKVTFTIAVPSIAERLATTLPKILNKLFEQAKGKPVEVMCLLDNKKMTLSEKRNIAIMTARGKFISFVDDDDMVEDDYVEKILGAVTLKPDSLCVVFDVMVHGYAVDGTWSTPEKPPVDKVCKYGIEFLEWNAPDTYFRKPNHVMVYNTKFARSLPAYINVRSEDYFWSMNAWKRMTPDRQVRIDKVLYHYCFDPSTTQQGACDWVMSNR